MQWRKQSTQDKIKDETIRQGIFLVLSLVPVAIGAIKGAIERRSKKKDNKYQQRSQ